MVTPFSKGLDLLEYHVKLYTFVDSVNNPLDVAEFNTACALEKLIPNVVNSKVVPILNDFFMCRCKSTFFVNSNIQLSYLIHKECTFLVATNR